MRLSDAAKSLVSHQITEDGLITLSFLSTDSVRDLEMAIYDNPRDTVREVLDALRMDTMVHYIQANYLDRRGAAMLEFLTTEW